MKEIGMSPTRSLKPIVLWMCLALVAVPALAARRSSRDGFYQTGQGKLGPDLFLAIGRNDLGGVKSLLARGADPNARDSLGGTPLANAAFGGPVPMIETLLRAG